MNKKANWFGEHKVLVIIISVVALLFLFFGGAKLWLMAKFLLGSDITVTLSADKESLSLSRGEQAELSFEAKVAANPFCQPSCSISFEDLSKAAVIDRDSFKIQPGIFTRREYTITAPQTGLGINLYRFNLECRAEASVLCHTAGISTTRSLLVTAEYGMTAEEQEIKEAFKQELNSLSGAFAELHRTYASLNLTFAALSSVADVSFYKIKLDELQKSISARTAYFEQTNESWNAQNYDALALAISSLNSSISRTAAEAADVDSILSSAVSIFNSAIDNLTAANQQLNQLNGITVLNSAVAARINETILLYNSAYNEINQRNPVEDKQFAAINLMSGIVDLSSFVEQQSKKDILQKEIELYSAEDALCSFASVCTEHHSISELANQQNSDALQTCSNVDAFKARLVLLNASLADEFTAQNYPITTEFWSDIKLKVQNEKQAAINNYSQQILENFTNILLLSQILTAKTIIPVTDYPGYDLKPALVSELLKMEMQNSCELTHVSFDVRNVELQKINISANQIAGDAANQIVFEEPVPMCCIHGDCKPCCTADSCRTDERAYPIVIVHGHAISKEVSAEYSLEGFNLIQKKLEDDGYINAGAVTLYTTLDTPPGIWGQFNVPLSIRASYYFDIFKQPENYVVVQANSENIETYAIRLKDVIDTVQYKTGKSKVNLIAFSMGGLVTRRYMQLFGDENINKVVLIGTPNHGVSGDVAQYCGVTGAALECRDLNKDSLFMNKITTGKKPTVPVVTIVGTGCKMSDGIGDGIVLTESGLLDFAENHIINGTCDNPTLPLHLNLLDVERYPEIYEIIKNTFLANDTRNATELND